MSFSWLVLLHLSECGKNACLSDRGLSFPLIKKRAVLYPYISPQIEPTSHYLEVFFDTSMTSEALFYHTFDFLRWCDC